MLWNCQDSEPFRYSVDEMLYPVSNYYFYFIIYYFILFYFLPCQFPCGSH